MLTNTQWAMLEPLIEICPWGKTALQDLRHTLSAILWRPTPPVSAAA
jgi:transposase